MRYLIFILILAGTFSASSQQVSSSNSKYFAQGLIDINSDQEIAALEQTMRLNPVFEIVRLDIPTKRFFLIINSSSNISESILKDWFGDYSDSLFCIQIGVYGIDAVNPFPFTDCDN